MWWEKVHFMEHKEDLINYRLKRAESTLEEAELAFKNNKLTLTENRIYYAIFYSVSALALRYDFETSKHSTLKGWFNKSLRGRNLPVPYFLACPLFFSSNY
jgi:uncharacterized protein (UPF0332 family)